MAKSRLYTYTMHYPKRRGMYDMDWSSLPPDFKYQPPDFKY